MLLQLITWKMCVILHQGFGGRGLKWFELFEEFEEFEEFCKPETLQTRNPSNP